MKLWAQNKKQKTVASISVRSQDKSGYHSLHHAVKPRTSALRETTPVKTNTQRRHQQQHLTNRNVTIDTKCAITSKPHWGEIISRSQTTQQYNTIIQKAEKLKTLLLPYSPFSRIAALEGLRGDAYIFIFHLQQGWAIPPLTMPFEPPVAWTRLAFTPA